MASTYSANLRFELQADGENSTTWGQITNTNLGTLIEHAICGYLGISMSDADTTLTANNGSADQARRHILKFTGTLTADRNIIVPAASKTYVIHNATTGGFNLKIKTSGGASVTVANGQRMIIMCDGTDCFQSAAPAGTTFGTSILTAADAAAGRTALALGSMATANTSSYVPAVGGQFTGAIGFQSGSQIYGTDPILEFRQSYSGTRNGYVQVSNAGNMFYVSDQGTQAHYWYGGANQNLVLDSSGNLTARANVSAYSDRKFKTNIRALSIYDAAEIVNQLKPSRFKKFGNEGIGFIAQDVREVEPSLVYSAGDGQDAPLAIPAGAEWAAILVCYCKNLQRQLDDLRKRLDDASG